MDRRQFLAASGLLLLTRRARTTTTRVALVTADLESHLVAVDLPGGHVRAHLPTAAYPRSVEAVGETAVVAHSDIGAVTLVHAPSLSIAHVLHDFGEPRYTAGHPDGRHAYVTDAGRGEIVALDLARRRVLAREAVGQRARHVSLDSAGRTLWIALGSSAQELAVVDVSVRTQPRLVRRFRPPFRAHDVAFAPNGRYVWVSSADRLELAVYEARSGRLLARPYADFAPQHVTFAGARAYVTSGWSGTLRVYGADGRSLRRTAVPVGSYNVQQALGLIVTPSLGHGFLTVLDESGRVVRSERVARSAHDACIVRTGLV